MRLRTKPLLKTVGRRLYKNFKRPELGMLVYLIENGKLLDVFTLQEWTLTDEWFHSETRNDNATFVLMLRWTNENGEECITLFGSADDADGFARRSGLGTHIRTRVRLIL